MNQKFMRFGAPVKKNSVMEMMAQQELMKIKREICEAVKAELYETVKAEVLDTMSTIFMAAFAVAISRKFPKWGGGAILDMMNQIDKIVGETYDMSIDEIVEFCADETGVRIQQEDVWAERVAEMQKQKGVGHGTRSN